MIRAISHDLKYLLDFSSFSGGTVLVLVTSEAIGIVLVPLDTVIVPGWVVVMVPLDGGGVAQWVIVMVLLGDMVDAGWVVVMVPVGGVVDTW